MKAVVEAVELSDAQRKALQEEIKQLGEEIRKLKTNKADAELVGSTVQNSSTRTVSVETCSFYVPLVVAP